MPSSDLLNIYQWVRRTAVEGGEGGWRPLLFVLFCVFLVRESLFLPGKCQGILNTDIHCNHDKTIRFCCLHRGFRRPCDSAA